MPQRYIPAVLAWQIGPQSPAIARLAIILYFHP
jgi:hypothetical protein